MIYIYIIHRYTIYFSGFMMIDVTRLFLEESFVLAEFQLGDFC